MPTVMAIEGSTDASAGALQVSAPPVLPAARAASELRRRGWVATRSLSDDAVAVLHAWAAEGGARSAPELAEVARRQALVRAATEVGALTRAPVLGITALTPLHVGIINGVVEPGVTVWVVWTHEPRISAGLEAGGFALVATYGRGRRGQVRQLLAA